MYDVAVIGGGPGGYKVAELLAKSGKKVAIIEKNNLGGVCLNQGCIPFKYYLHSTHTYENYNALARNGIINQVGDRINLDALRNNKQDIINGLQKGVEMMLKGCGVDIIYGMARICEASDDGVILSIDDLVIECDKLVIATGSKENDSINVQDSTTSVLINSDKMLELTEIPYDIDIIGGGAIGLEAASFFAELGSKITIIEAQDTIGGHIDSELANIAKKVLNKKGIKIHTNTSFLGFEGDDVIYQNREERIVRKPQYIFMSVGRKPLINKEMFDALGIEYTDNGIEIDDSCRTSKENIYACGDVTGRLMLAHTAYKQARVICDSINGTDSRIDYSTIARIIYSSPQILSVGLTEKDCAKEKIEYRVKFIPMTYNGKYFAEYGKDGSRAKMIVGNDDRIIGIHMIGRDIAELSFVAELIVMSKLSVEEVCKVPVAHPTYGEIIVELAEEFLYDS